MRSPLLSSMFVALLLAACGDDGGGDGTVIDAPGGGALMATEVSCTGVQSPVITTAGSAYSPASTTVAPNTVVKFTMPGDHNAISNDSLFTADFNGDTCIRFETVGSYRFHCGPHGFLGTVVVAP
jgi:plastocyanin